MEQSIAVKKMMLTIKLEGEIPESLYCSLRNKFKQMFAVGYDRGREEAFLHRRKIILQYNSEGKLVNTFNGLREASCKTGFEMRAIQSAAKRESTSRQGFRWRYAGDIKKDRQYIGPFD